MYTNSESPVDTEPSIAAGWLSTTQGYCEIAIGEDSNKWERSYKIEGKYFHGCFPFTYVLLFKHIKSRILHASHAIDAARAAVEEGVTKDSDDPAPPNGFDVILMRMRKRRVKGGGLVSLLAWTGDWNRFQNRHVHLSLDFDVQC
jgi:hypothetical protein